MSPWSSPAVYCLLYAVGVVLLLALLALLVEVAVLALLVGLSWLIMRRLIDQAAEFVRHVPELAARLADQVSAVLEVDPRELPDSMTNPDRLRSVLPSIGSALARVGAYSLTAATGLVVEVSVLAMPTYAVVSPTMLLRGYLWLSPESLQAKAVFDDRPCYPRLLRGAAADHGRRRRSSAGPVAGQKGAG